MDGDLVKRGDEPGSGTPSAQAARGETIDLETFLPYRLSVLANQVSRAIARIYEDRWRISIAEWRLIANLARFGPMSAGEVCDRAAMDKVRVSRAVAAATASGLVDRRTDSVDRRRSVLTLSARGWDVYRAIVPLARHVEETLLADLPEAERRALLSLLDRVQARADSLDLSDQPAD